jgi:hypothetical protein
MKKFVSKIQGFGQKAQEIRQMVASAPPRFAELRESVLASAGQIQNLRADVQAAVTTLRTDSEERLIEALREIDASADTFRAAGYHLDDVEMELAIPQRLIVHLEKVTDVGASTLRSLVSANASRPTTHAILSALVKAEEMADKVDLTNLGYHKLMVHVGTVPNVRLCWCATTPGERVSEPAVTATPVAPTVPAKSAGPQLGESAFGSSFFSADSFFERSARPTPAVSPKVEEAATAAPKAEQGSGVAEAPADWRRDALARFKKMPDLSK